MITIYIHQEFKWIALSIIMMNTLKSMLSDRAVGEFLPGLISHAGGSMYIPYRYSSQNKAGFFT